MALVAHLVPFRILFAVAAEGLVEIWRYSARVSGLALSQAGQTAMTDPVSSFLGAPRRNWAFPVRARAVVVVHSHSLHRHHSILHSNSHTLPDHNLGRNRHTLDHHSHLSAVAAPGLADTLPGAAVDVPVMSKAVVLASLGPQDHRKVPSLIVGQAVP